MGTDGGGGGGVQLHDLQEPNDIEPRWLEPKWLEPKWLRRGWFSLQRHTHDDRAIQALLTHTRGKIVALPPSYEVASVIVADRI